MIASLRIPKVQLILTLVIIFLSTLLEQLFFANFVLVLTALFFTVCFDLLFTYIRRKKLFVPFAAIVSGLIIGMLVDSSASWYELTFIAIFAMGIKNFLRITNRHLVNPAASGLVLGSIFFHQHVAWWAVSFQNITQFTLSHGIAFLLLLFPLFVSGYTLHRYVTSLSFLILYALGIPLIAASFSLQSIASMLVDPTVVFFAIVMLPEPMTSPVNKKRQLLYGLCVAVLTLFFSFPTISNLLQVKGLLPDPLLMALLLGNLLFFKFR